MSSLYAFSLGWNVPLVQLHNVENHLGTVNRLTTPGALIPVSIASSIADPLPVRTNDQAGGESGDGFMNQDWFLRLTQYGYLALLNEVWAGGTTTQTALTIYTRRHEYADFVRYNVWAIRPSPARGDVVPERDNAFNGAFRIRVPLRDLVEAS